MFVSVEMDDHGYGKVHRTGCRDLRDPFPLGPVETWAEAFARIAGCTPDDLRHTAARCVGSIL